MRAGPIVERASSQLVVTDDQIAEAVLRVRDAHSIDNVQIRNALLAGRITVFEMAQPARNSTDSCANRPGHSKGRERTSA